MSQSVLVETLGAIWKEQASTHPDLMSCDFEVDLNGTTTVTGSAMTNTNTLDLRMPHSSSELVNEIVRIMKESSEAISQDVVFHDRGTLESALLDALDQCSYESLFEISSDWEESRRNQRRDYYHQCLLSSLPHQLLDEIELDEEIDGIEEEIARLQEQKLLLKGSSSSMDSSYGTPSSHPSSPDSLVGSSTSPSPSSSPSTDDVETYIPPPVAKTKTDKRKRSLEHQARDSTSKLSKKTKKACANPIDIELELSFSHNISHIERDYRRKPSTSSSSSLSSSSASASITHKKVKRKDGILREQVLKIKPVVTMVEDDEDEDIDILN